MLGEDKRYIALSHCWGGRTPLVLQTGNIDDLKQGVRVSELPLSFQHAISMTRSLGIRYLWIDSLCIIQDSSSDWELEVGRMKGVYKNALVTIAATGAKNSTVGLFFDRNVDLALPVFINIAWVGLPRGVYKVYDGLLWSQNISEAPLSKRAWVVQERLLSRRTVHFGQSQVAWECQESRACETFPDTLPSNVMGGADDISLRTLFHHYRSTLASMAWPRIAEDFASRRLTKEADKCVAISGIAEEIHDSIGDRYIAGMWQSCLVPQMCWSIFPGINDCDDIIARRPSTYRAPSWSWLSIDSHIHFHRDGTIHSCKVVFDVLNVEVENTGPNPFGSIRSGQILGCGMLRLGRLAITESNAKILVLGDRVVQKWGRDHITYFMLDVDSDERHINVWCLPLVTDQPASEPGNNNLRYFGIILVESGQRDNEYKRIGCFQLSYDSNDDYLQLLAGYRHYPTWSIATLV